MGRMILAVLAMAALAAPAVAEKIELENGDTIDVTIVSETDDSLVVEHPQLGEFTVPRSALKPPAPPNPGLFGTRFMEGWSRSIGAGFGGASGNSQDASANGSIDFSKETDAFRGVFNSTYFFSSQNGVTNTNAFQMNYQHDFLLSDSPFFLFINARYQYDQFQDWSHRISGNGGVGYDILRKKKGHVSIELGAGVARTQGTVKFLPPPFPGNPPQDFLIVNRAWKPEGVAGVNAAWRPLEGHELAGDFTFFPNFKTGPNGQFQFRFIMNAWYQIAITGIKGLNLKFGVTDEYDNSVDNTAFVPNVTPPRLQSWNNLKYYGNLVYEF